MKFPVLRAPTILNIIIIIISGFISLFTLTFGIAHMFGERNPDIPDSEHMLGVAMVVILCLIGLIALVVIIAAIRGIIERDNQKRSE